MATKNDSYLVADTSGLISLASETDSNHAPALAAAKALADHGQAILLPQDVFSETINVAGKILGHAAAVEIAEYLLTTPLFVLLDSTEDIRTRALEQFVQLPASVSYTDCVVMVCADEYANRRIFGFDGIFSQRGYLIIRQLVNAA